MSAPVQEAFHAPQGDLMMGDYDGPVELEGDGLRPMDWETEASRPSIFSKSYRFLEEFAEWLVVSCKSILTGVGMPMVSGMSLLIKSVLVLALACALLYCGLRLGNMVRTTVTPEVRRPVASRPALPKAALNEPSGPAQDVVNDYLRELGQGRMSVAYNDLSPAWKAELPYQKFADSYAEMQNIEGKIVKVRQVNPRSYELEVDLEVKLSGVPRKYHGVYVAEQTDDGWKINSGVVH
jgi:hypothetical protein